jgi:hypothetical protein
MQAKGIAGSLGMTLIGFALGAAPVSADQKANELIAKVQAAVDQGLPIEADYTVLFADGADTLISRQRFVKTDENHLSHTSSTPPHGKMRVADLPPRVVDLFDPFLSNYAFTGAAEAKTQFLGTRKVGDITYEIVQASYPWRPWANVTQTWYIGADSRVHRMEGRLEIRLLRPQAGKKDRVVAMSCREVTFKRPEPPEEPVPPPTLPSKPSGSGH